MLHTQGWGCGYRTLQTIASYLSLQQQQPGKKAGQVPSLKEIQETLVAIEDKKKSFVGSREWIGSFEVCWHNSTLIYNNVSDLKSNLNSLTIFSISQVCLVIDKLFDVPCKILHCPSGENAMTDIFPKLEEHFAKSSARPIMMGGDHDASSKGVLGTCCVDNDHWLLVLVREKNF
jgi:hypothetical protein